MSRNRRAGFTLLEVMIAMAILSVSLVGLYLTTGRAIRISMHARSMTQATFLCRQKMAEIQNEFVTEGFKDEAGAKEDRGDFPDPAFKQFRYVTIIEKIRLPATDQLQSAATKMLQDKQSAAGKDKPSSSSSSSGSNMASGISNILKPIKKILKQNIHHITIKIL